MKTNCLIPKRYLVAASLMLIGVVLTCYSAGAKARRGSEENRSSGPDILRTENDDDPEYREQRREFLNRFLGNRPGAVSASAYKKALAEARALPRSPLLEGRMFRSPETPGAVAPWTSPIAPPIMNSYSANASAAIYSLAIDPINANIVYTGSFGGLAKTTDGGGTWRYLSDSWKSQSISAIAINPSASNDVYVGTGREGAGYASYEVGIYRSFDGGSTWSSPLGETQFEDKSIRAIAIDPNAPNSQFATTLYVANGCDHGCGLWRSNDSGVTWSQLYEARHGVYDVAMDVATHPSALYITEDNGTFKSTDSGQSWTSIHDVLEGSRNRVSVVNSAIYLLGPDDLDHNLYKSVDGGATWIQIPTNCFAGADSCRSNNSIGFGVFAVDPANPQNIVAGNMALYRTDNEGLTWTEIGHWWGDPKPTRCIHPDQRVIAFSQTAPGVVYVGNDAGVVKSTNAGQHWTNLNQNFPGALLYGVALSRDGTMIAGTQDNGVIFSDPRMPYGRTWDAIYGGDSAHNLIDPIDSRVAYFTMYGKNVWKRVTRPTPGATPAPAENIRPSQFEGVDGDSACSFFPTLSMNPLAPKHLVAACQRVVRTLDGTASPAPVWTTIGNGPAAGIGVVAVVTAATEAPSNSNVIYAVTNYETVFVTSNASLGNGATWQQITQFRNPGGISTVKVDPTNYQIAYLAADSGIYKTTDMGTSWTPPPDTSSGYGIPNLIYRDVAIDPAYPQHIFAASNAGVFASTDGGLSWGDMSEGIPSGMVVSSLSFNAASRQLAAATYGRGVYLLDVTRPVQPPRPRPTPRPRP
ncbi:MAG: WD40/YVTN/BNR-like repeat-containing protein [Chthoniobacterales bacterium]